MVFVIPTLSLCRAHFFKSELFFGTIWVDENLYHLRYISVNRHGDGLADEIFKIYDLFMIYFLFKHLNLNKSNIFHSRNM